MKKKGITLVELMAYMAILTIFMSMFFTLFLQLTKTNVKTEDKIVENNEGRVEIIQNSVNNTNKGDVNISVMYNTNNIDWSRAFVTDINVKGVGDIRANSVKPQESIASENSSSTNINLITPIANLIVYKDIVSSEFKPLELNNNVLNISNVQIGNFIHNGDLTVHDVVSVTDKLNTAITIVDSIILVKGKLNLYGISGSDRDIVLNNSIIIATEGITTYSKTAHPTNPNDKYDSKCSDIIMNNSALISLKDFYINADATNKYDNDVQITMDNSVIYTYGKFKTNDNANTTITINEQSNLRANANNALINLLNKANKLGLLDIEEVN